MSKEKIASRIWNTPGLSSHEAKRLLDDILTIVAPPAPAQAEEKLCYPFSVNTCNKPGCICREEKAAALKAPKVPEPFSADEALREVIQQQAARVAELEREVDKYKGWWRCACMEQCVKCGHKPAEPTVATRLAQPTPAQASKADGSPMPAEQPATREWVRGEMEMLASQLVIDPNPAISFVGAHIRAVFKE